MKTLKVILKFEYSNVESNIERLRLIERPIKLQSSAYRFRCNQMPSSRPQLGSSLGIIGYHRDIIGQTTGIRHRRADMIKG